MHIQYHNQLLNALLFLLILTMYYELFQAENVRDAAWGCDWIGTPVPFQRCLIFIIATANKGFTLTAGKFVPVSNTTMMNVRILIVPSTTIQLHLSYTVPSYHTKLSSLCKLPNPLRPKYDPWMKRRFKFRWYFPGTALPNAITI
jgi:hypothetical protein